ncbi:YopX family protein [Peribacillus muralis]|uniref:YopX family protein n=1 Tax=Peribacillus muralis TaxID=264697 RepID=UPI00366FBF49
MREIKIRAWDNVEMKWYYPGEEDDIHFYFDSSGIVAERFIEEEVCTPEGERGMYGGTEKLEHLIYVQLTELKDKNGVEIYEGDILDVQDEGYPFVKNWKGIVKMIDCCYMIENLEGTDGEPLFIEIREIEVIGNIYENPKLLES